MVTLIVHLGTRWRWVVSITLPPLYPPPPRFTLNKKLGGTQFWSAYCVEKSFACLGEQPRFLGRQSLSIVTILTELSQLTPELLYGLEDKN
jgi:hypothetical protein